MLDSLKVSHCVIVLVRSQVGLAIKHFLPRFRHYWRGSGDGMGSTFDLELEEVRDSRGFIMGSCFNAIGREGGRANAGVVSHMEAWQGRNSFTSLRLIL